MAALHNHLPEAYGGEQCWDGLLHRDALRHVASGLHLHHGLQMGDDQGHGGYYALPLPHLCGDFSGTVRMLDGLPDIEEGRKEEMC